MGIFGPHKWLPGGREYDPEDFEPGGIFCPGSAKKPYGASYELIIIDAETGKDHHFQIAHNDKIIVAYRELSMHKEMTANEFLDL